MQSGGRSAAVMSSMRYLTKWPAQSAIVIVVHAHCWITPQVVLPR